MKTKVIHIDNYKINRLRIKWYRMKRYYKTKIKLFIKKFI